MFMRAEDVDERRLRAGRGGMGGSSDLQSSSTPTPGDVSRHGSDSRGGNGGLHRSTMVSDDRESSKNSEDESTTSDQTLVINESLIASSIVYSVNDPLTAFPGAFAIIAENIFVGLATRVTEENFITARHVLEAAIVVRDEQWSVAVITIASLANLKCSYKVAVTYDSLQFGHSAVDLVYCTPADGSVLKNFFSTAAIKLPKISPLRNLGNTIITIVPDLANIRMQASTGEIVNKLEALMYEHSASTISGSSGAPIYSLSGKSLIGVHIGNNKDTGNNVFIPLEPLRLLLFSDKLNINEERGKANLNGDMDDQDEDLRSFGTDTTSTNLGSTSGAVTYVPLEDFNKKNEDYLNSIYEAAFAGPKLKQQGKIAKFDVQTASIKVQDDPKPKNQKSTKSAIIIANSPGGNTSMKTIVAKFPKYYRPRENLNIHQKYQATKHLKEFLADLNNQQIMQHNAEPRNRDNQLPLIDPNRVGPIPTSLDPNDQEKKQIEDGINSNDKTEVAYFTKLKEFFSANFMYETVDMNLLDLLKKLRLATLGSNLVVMELEGWKTVEKFSFTQDKSFIRFYLNFHKLKSNPEVILLTRIVEFHIYLLEGAIKVPHATPLNYADQIYVADSINKILSNITNESSKENFQSTSAQTGQTTQAKTTTTSQENTQEGKKRRKRRQKKNKDSQSTEAHTSSIQILKNTSNKRISDESDTSQERETSRKRKTKPLSQQWETFMNSQNQINEKISQTLLQLSSGPKEEQKQSSNPSMPT